MWTAPQKLLRNREKQGEGRMIILPSFILPTIVEKR